MKLSIACGEGTSPPVPNRRLLQVAGVYFGLSTIVAAWLWQSWGGAEVTRLVDNLASLIGILFAVGCAGWAAYYSEGRMRRGWLAMTGGLCAWATGEAIWFSYEQLLRYEQTPFPSWADAAYLLFYGGAGVAVLLLSTTDHAQSWTRVVLDGLIIAGSAFLISWVAVVNKVFEAGADSGLALAVSMAYPLGDVAIITIVWARGVAAYRPSLGLLVAGLLVIALSDSAYAAMTTDGTYYTGHFVDLGWILGCGLIGMAALRSVGESLPHRRLGPLAAQVRLWGPYLPLVVAAAVALHEAVPALGSAPLAGAMVFIVVAVLARQFIVLAENRQLLNHVSRLAFRDQLTGLANRALFLDRVEQAVARHNRDVEPFAVLCLDLDDFKMVNDELGHPAGDELLVRVARRLSGCLRSTDTIARFGGDEFAVLITGAPDEALVAAERILDAFTEPVAIDGITLTVRPSIGLTFATFETSPATVDDLLRHADLAMYAAKRDGGGCLRSFVPDLPDPFEIPRATASSVKRAASPAPPPRAANPAPMRAATTPKQDWPAGRIHFVLALLTAGVVVYAISTLVRSEPGRIILFDTWLESALYLFACAVVAARACRLRDERAAWSFIAAGMFATAVGTVLIAIWARDGDSPSIADPVFLVFYPAVYLGLLLLVRRRIRRIPPLIRLDGIIAGFTAAGFGAALLSDALDGATGASLAVLLLTMALPVGAVLLLAVVIASVTVLGWPSESRWVLLLVGFVFWVAANIVYCLQAAHGAYVQGTLLDAVWPISFLLIAVAAWIPPATEPTEPRSGALVRFATPIVCTVIALGIVLFEPDDRLAVILAALTLTVIAARFAVTLREPGTSGAALKGAMTDELTGLPNRRALATALSEETQAGSVAYEGATARQALLLLDINHFDEITAAFDPSVGDEVLRRIATRLSRAVRPEDLVARSGGDEFAILLRDGVNLMTARAQAGSVMDALRPAFALDHITVQIDVSISIAMWPEHCSHPQELLSRAEAALPKARTTQSRIAVYDPAVDLQKGIDEQLIDDLRAALSAVRDNDDDDDEHSASGELVCYYQPKISAVDERVHSVEALVRWQHPTRGQLLPDDFLPAAERAGLMRPVATRVLDIALAQIRSWRDDGLALTVAVNLSTTNLLDLGLVDTIERLLNMHRVPAEALILEITEGTLTTDSQRSLNTVNALRRLGIRLSLDDYGTGWSSLARLQNLSVDELKLDKVFIARLARDPRSIAIVRSTVALAHSLGAELVAEGVEDEATLRALRRYGCTITQGHVHSRPLPAAQLHEWLVSRTPSPALATRQRPTEPERL